jgi:hypothetical protein
MKLIDAGIKKSSGGIQGLMATRPQKTSDYRRNAESGG